MCNGLGISCHFIINHLHNFAAIANIYVHLHGIQPIPNFKLWLPRFGSYHPIEQPSRSTLISHSCMTCMNKYWICPERGHEFQQYSFYVVVEKRMAQLNRQYISAVIFYMEPRCTTLNMAEPVQNCISVK